jgi:hypothetical protein
MLTPDAELLLDAWFEHCGMDCGGNDPIVEAAAQALADVRTLDDWADRFSRVHALHRVNGTGWACTLEQPLRESLQYFGATPDEARA